MPEITIYTTPGCSYCLAAKELFGRKHLAYREIDVGGNAEARASMISRAGGRRTVPQIFVGDTHIGGFDDLHDLDAKGYLDAIIAESTSGLSAA